jgi:hypothetical protein
MSIISNFYEKIRRKKIAALNGFKMLLSQNLLKKNARIVFII